MAKNKILERLDQIDEKLRHFESLFPVQKINLTLDDLVQYTGFSKSFLYKKTCAGEIPCSKPGGKVLFFNKDLIDIWLQKNRKKSKDEIERDAATFVTLNSKK